MPKVLSSAQIEQYQQLGFVSPVDVMSEADACEFKQRFEQMEKAYPEHVNAENRNNAHLIFSCLDELAHHPIIVDAVEDLIGKNIALWGSVLFIKNPQSKGYVSWHQDATYMGIVPHNFVSPWLALTHSTIDNGCMRMIAGSHKQPVQPHVDTFEADNVLTRGQAVEQIDATNAVDLILRPGQMSLHHALTVHASNPNKSRQRRIGFVMQSYMPAEAMQTIGDNNWMPIRGDNPRAGSYSLSRPQFDMAPSGLAERARANQNFSNILYHGAAEQRAY